MDDFGFMQWLPPAWRALDLHVSIPKTYNIYNITKFDYPLSLLHHTELQCLWTRHFHIDVDKLILHQNYNLFSLVCISIQEVLKLINWSDVTTSWAVWQTKNLLPLRCFYKLFQVTDNFGWLSLINIDNLTIRFVVNLVLSWQLLLRLYDIYNNQTSTVRVPGTSGPQSNARLTFSLTE